MITLNDFDIVKISDSKLKDISGGARWSINLNGTITDHIDDYGCSKIFSQGGGYDTCDDTDLCTK